MMSKLDEQEREFARLVERLPLDDAPRAAHRDALRAEALAAFHATPTVAPATVGWKRVLQTGRQIMGRPIPRLIAVSAACLAIAAVWMFVPGRQTTAQAFNMYAKALVDARSATFQMKVHIEGQPKQSFKCYYLAPGKFRQELPAMVIVSDFGEGKMVNLAPDQKRAVVMNLMNVPEEPDGRQTYDTFERLRQLLSERLDSKEDEYVRLGEKEIDGHRAVGFRGSTSLASVTMWGDPKTGMPILVETVWSGIPRVEATMSDFELDVDLQPELFDTTPPADYTVQTFDVDASKFTEADLVKALRAISDMNDGQFLDGLNTASMMKVMIKRLIGDEEEKGDKKDKKKDITQEMMKISMTIGRGISFALELPESADAHYAGKGVKRGEPDRPIFWYQPEGTKQYRVIYADLSVKDEAHAPDVPGAVRLEKTNPTADASSK